MGALVLTASCRGRMRVFYPRKFLAWCHLFTICPVIQTSFGDLFRLISTLSNDLDILRRIISFYLLWCLANYATSAKCVLLWIDFLVYTFLISAYKTVAYAMCPRDYVSGWRPVWFCWGFQFVGPVASGVTPPAAGLIALNMVQLPVRWSGSIRVNAWWNRWRDMIAMHAAISSWAYSRLTAVLLGACSYAKWSIFLAITIMYITANIYIYVYPKYIYIWIPKKLNSLLGSDEKYHSSRLIRK